LIILVRGCFRPSDKSLLGIYAQYRCALPASKANVLTMIVIAIASAIVLGFSFGFRIDGAEEILSLSSLVIQIVSQLIGFLIAGYTIFLSIISEENLKLLNSTKMRTRKDAPGASEPEYERRHFSMFSYFNWIFLDSIINYVFVFIVAMMAYILASAAEKWLFYHVGYYRFSMYYCLVISCVLMILHLKIFVFNLFSILRLVIKLKVKSRL
jgi:hypothetical protein